MSQHASSKGCAFKLVSVTQICHVTTYCHVNSQVLHSSMTNNICVVRILYLLCKDPAMLLVSVESCMMLSMQGQALGSVHDYLSFRENSMRTRSDSGLTIASKHCAAVLDVMPPIAEFPI